jgi:hypothetical protein
MRVQAILLEARIEYERFRPAELDQSEILVQWVDQIISLIGNYGRGNGYGKGGFQFRPRRSQILC